MVTSKGECLAFGDTGCGEACECVCVCEVLAEADVVVKSYGAVLAYVDVCYVCSECEAASVYSVECGGVSVAGKCESSCADVWYDATSYECSNVSYGRSV